MSANGRESEPNPDEPVFTTLAIGEEGDSDPGPGLAFMPHPGGRPWESPGRPPFAGDGDGTNPGRGKPVFTTLAIGEEGDSASGPGAGVAPRDPAGGGGTFTTLAIGEEGDPAFGSGAGVAPRDPAGDGGTFTTLAIGEEGDSGPMPTTLAIGEEGDVDPVLTTRALGEEGDAGSPPEAGTVPAGPAGRPWEGTATTLALGEKGDAGHGGWDS